jgi:hypothetical protein
MAAVRAFPSTCYERSLSMSKPAAYSDFADVFAATVARALDLAVDTWTDNPRVLRKRDEFTLALRVNFDRVHPMLTLAQADEAVSRCLGQIYGNLVTHLQAIYAYYEEFRCNLDLGINIYAVASDCTARAIAAATRYTDMAARVLSQLQLERALARGRAEVFAAQIDRYLKQHRLTCGPNACVPHVVFIASQTRSEVEFKAMYFHGPHPRSALLGAWFSESTIRPTLASLADHQAYLRATAQQVFGNRVELDDDLSRIRLSVPDIDFGTF